MAAIQFPANPNVGDLFTASNGIRYTYDGEKWKTLGTSTVGSEGQFLETPTVLTVDKLIPANTNTGVVGPIAIGTGVVLTVPSSSTFRTLTGRSGAGSGGNTEIEPKMPISGGTFTGPVNFANDAIIKGNAVDGSGKLTLNCENNSHGIHIKGPPHSAGANYTLTLPNDTGTNGQVLTTNGSGVSSWSTIDLSSKLSLTGGTLTGDLTIPDKIIHSGDTDTSIRFPSANTFAIETAGTQRVTVDSSGNVGIGLTSVNSTRRVEIKQPSSYSAALRILADGNGNDGLIQWFSGLSQYEIGVNQGTDALLFKRDGSEKMRITSAGRVGIGTTSPTFPLQVETTATGTTAGSNGVMFVQSQASGRDAHIRFGDSVNATARVGYLSNSLYAYVNGQERARIDNAGRLLVGTSSSPTAGSGAIAKSVIQGNTSNSAGAGYLSLQRGQAAASIGTNETLGQINFSDSSGFDYAIIKGQTAAAGGSNDYPGKLIFGTSADGAATTTDRMVIDSSGNVGIGTSNPDKLLHVVSSGNTRTKVSTTSASSFGQMYFGDEDKYVIGYRESHANQARQLSFKNTHSSGTITFRAGGDQERMRIDSSGRLLVGTTAAATNAEVTVRAVSPQLSLYATPGNVSRVTLGDTDDYDIGQIGYDNSDNSMFFSANNATRMRIDSAGKVDITTGIIGKNPSDNFTLNGKTQPFYGFNLVGTASAPTSMHGYYGLVFGTSTSERLRIDSSGNVGIGTTSPTANLEVSETGANAGVLVNRTDAATAGTVSLNAGNTVNYINNSGTKDFIINTNNTERLRINSSGNVGIGTQSPDSKLHVVDSSNNGLRIGYTGNTNYYDAPLHIWRHPNFFTERMRIDSNGNVLVGTTTAVGRMTVKIDTNKNISFNGAQGEIGNVSAFVAHQDGGSLASLGMRGTDLRFATGSAERLRIDSSGRVGIGTTNPSATLHVNGTGQYSGGQRGAVSTHNSISGTFTMDLNTANNFKITFIGNTTINNPSNQTAGQHGVVALVQDGTGGRTLSFGSNWKFPGGTAPTNSTGSNAQDLLAYYVAASGTIYAQLIVDLK